MQFFELEIGGVFRIELTRLEDERGFFARTYCREEFAERGLATDFVQCSTSFSRRAATLRGMHYQRPPAAEAKLVRCISGAVFDVAIDLRRDSPTYLRHAAMILSAENRKLLYIPEGCAHGFLSLLDDTEVIYQISMPYSSEQAAGVRWNDPAFGIEWPMEPSVISERDANFPDFEP